MFVPQQLNSSPVLVIDGNAVVHRAFHARIGKWAQNTSVVQANDHTRREGLSGVLTLLADIANQVQPGATVVGFDTPGGSFRCNEWPAYKAQRPPKSDALRDLLARTPELLDALGISVECHDPFEADDVCGSVAANAEGQGQHCVIATADRDAFGLITGYTRVLHLSPGLGNHALIDRDKLYAKYGVQANQYTQFAALRGDPSDNLPGVKGIGPKRAAQLLQRYPTIEDAIHDPTGCLDVLGARLGKALLDDWHDEHSMTRRNIALMTIQTNVPIRPETYADRAPVDQVQAVLEDNGLGAMAWRTCLAFGEPGEHPPLPDEPWPLAFGDEII
ncbi:5'-3' exonuclease [Stomatohabitans albus]|uniref:5'-3' exonuclease n=1 Tax=Stomatohabitans albus TaxID=3110766 RepID=UPI00300D6943